MPPAKVFVSAGESSGDMYASQLVEALRVHWPETEFFGCAGPRMQRMGVRPVVDSRALAVVGLVEVVRHLPRIYGLYRKLLDAVAAEKPTLAILTDSPDLHLRVARQLHAAGIPVVYLVAPQAWAWRQGRVKQMRRTIGKLLCLFPFEEAFYRQRGVDATYIGHPLARRIRPEFTRAQFFSRHRLDEGRPLVALCPGSRMGEIARHLPALADSVPRIASRVPAQFILASPLGFSERAGEPFFRERIPLEAIQVIEGETWDVLAHADLALAASGTVTMEAALLGTPLVTYYKVTGASWLLGKLLVRVPHYSMVNLLAGRRLVPELMQNEMTGEQLSEQAIRLLESEAERARMREAMAEIRAELTSEIDPMERAGQIVREFTDEDHKR
jgi:lipid-A-disaccharide synthase